jgi:hypothetical protein
MVRILCCVCLYVCVYECVWFVPLSFSVCVCVCVLSHHVVLNVSTPLPPPSRVPRMFLHSHEFLN